jgi:hypothetical protein
MRSSAAATCLLFCSLPELLSVEVLRLCSFSHGLLLTLDHQTGFF